MQMASVTASLLGTASYSSYGLTASYALNVIGSWNSASYTSPTQSVAGFGVDGRAILYTPTQDNMYLAKRGNTISWVPIETKFSAASYADDQNYTDVVSQSINYSNPSAIIYTEETQDPTARIREVYQITEKEYTDMLQIVMSLTSSVGFSFVSDESFDTVNGLINKTGSMISATLIDMSQELADFFINKSGSMISNLVVDGNIDYADFFINKSGSMVSTFVIDVNTDYADFFVNKSGSMIYSNTYDSTIEYVDSVIYITGSMQPLFTTTPFTTASI
jgi:hypothetical protein